MTLLACENLVRASGKGSRAVNDVSFTAGPGEILGLVGPNGAGKTTLLRMIAGDLGPSAGIATVATHRCGTRAARALVGYAPDPPVIPPELTGLEWLRYLASHYARNSAERLALVRSAVEIGVLDDFVGRRVGHYSRGMAQRLALASATLCGRSVVLLDEALSGVDPLIARALRHNLSRLAATGRLVVLASHDLATIEQLATRALILSRGRVVADVSMAALLGERTVELSLNGGALASASWLLHRFRGALRTGGGVAIPLLDGLSTEQVLNECHSHRIVVAASRVRYRRLEDILIAAEEAQ